MLILSTSAEHAPDANAPVESASAAATSSPTTINPITVAPRRPGEWTWWWLAVLALVVTRLPIIEHASGQQDEDCFAIPGWTVLREGIPRLPYCPSRNRSSFFENADVCLFALPPALFYVQAPFFLVLPASYPAARMPLLVAGIIGLTLLWRLARRVIDSSWIVGLALLLIAVSRPMMFTATTARPDLLCAACGWGALLSLWRWEESRLWRWIIVAGACCGAGMLCHPFAIVFCLQAGLWTLLSRGTLLQRLTRASLLTGCALLVFSAWLPLILAYPYEFRSQFGSNVLDRSGPGLTSRLVWPWPSLAHQTKLQWEFNEPYQFVLLIVGTSLGVLAWFQRGLTTERRRYLWMTGSAAYLTATCAGVHPTKGYWIYPIGLMYPLVVDGVHAVFARCCQVSPQDALSGASKWCRGVCCLLLFGLMIPGMGLRTISVYWRYWGDERYHARNFITRILQEEPREGNFLVNDRYVFDVYVSGRKTTLCQWHEIHYPGQTIEFDYLWCGRRSETDRWSHDYPSTLLRQYGTDDTGLECHLDILRPVTTTPAATPEVPSSTTP